MRKVPTCWLLVALVAGTLGTAAFGQGILIARYHMDEPSWAGAGSVLDDVGGYNGTPTGSPLPTTSISDPAIAGGLGTCGYGAFPGPEAGGGGVLVTGLPVSTAAGAQTSVAFWMYWDGADIVMPVGWYRHDLYFYQPPTGAAAVFGFNTGNSNDVYGIASTGLANGWHHVAAVFTNGSVTQDALYIDGVAQTLSQQVGTPFLADAVVGSDLHMGGWGQNTGYRFSSRIDEVNVFNGALTQAQVTALYNETHSCLRDVPVPATSWAGLAALVVALLAAGFFLLRLRG